jgi:hypothetical protein
MLRNFKDVNWNKDFSVNFTATDKTGTVEVDSIALIVTGSRALNKGDEVLIRFKIEDLELYLDQTYYRALLTLVREPK